MEKNKTKKKHSSLENWSEQEAAKNFMEERTMQEKIYAQVHL